MTQAWLAPVTRTPVRATVSIPGSKSITNRALILAALADGPSALRAPLRSRDTHLMADALRSLGAGIADEGNDWLVTPSTLRGPADVDCGLAGTVMRFVPPAAAIADGEIRFDGDEYARERPMGTILNALRGLGADITGDRLPFTLAGKGALAGGEVTIDASASSQFVSGLLLSGCRYDNGLTVRHDGKPVPSMPHIEMTVQMLRTAGVDVDDTEADTWQVRPGPIHGREWVIEPDLSNATPFLAAAAVTGGTVTVTGWPAETTQPGDAIREILANMGCDVELSTDGLAIRGPGPRRGWEPPQGAGTTLSGVDVDLHEVGELTPTVAALAALAEGQSVLRGIAHLRGHETDRLKALANELNALGGDVEETDDGLVIRPRPLHGGPWAAYADHRMATAGAILGLVVDGVEVDDIGCTTKTIPDFPGMWSAMLGGN